MKVNIFGDKVRDLLERCAYDWIKCDPEPKEFFYEDDILIPTIYFLTDMSGIIQYVGQTRHLALRIAQHRSNPKMRSRIDWQRTFYLSPGIKTESNRLRFEAAFIGLFSPPGNKVILLRHLKNGRWSAVRWKSGKSPFRRIRITKKGG